MRRRIDRLTAIPGIGPTAAARLVRRGITTRAQLRTIIAELPRTAQAHLRYRVCKKVPYATAAAVIKELRRRLVFCGTKRYPTCLVGSVRRRAPFSKDLDLLVIAGGRGHDGVLASARLVGPRPGDRLSFAETYADGARRRSLIVKWASPGKKRPSYYTLDLFLATPEEKPYALFHYTGGRAYNIRIRAHAKRRGMILNQYGLYYASGGGGRRVRGSRGIRNERDLIRYLGITHRPPPQRG